MSLKRKLLFQISTFILSSIQPCFAAQTLPQDSDAITPNDNYKVQILHQEIDQVPKSHEFDNLPICQNINCPDANGKLTDPTKSKNCPDSCRVEDIVKYTTPSPGINILQSFTASECPDGYTLGEEYGEGMEVLYSKTPPPYSYPITSPILMQMFQANGADCRLDGRTQVKNHCQSGTVDYPTGYQGIFDGGYAMVVNDGRTSDCYDQYSCPGPSTLSCSLPTTKRLYKTQFQWYICAPKPGYYLTGKSAPNKKVCVRTHLKWQTN